MMHRLAESGLRVPDCATLLSRMETSPGQEVEAPVLKFTTVFNTSTTNLLTSSYIHLKV